MSWVTVGKDRHFRETELTPVATFLTKENFKMIDEHEMRMIRGKIRAVYTDASGNEYIIVDGEKVFI